MDYVKIIIAIFTGSVATVIGSILVYFFSERSNRKKELKIAQVEIRDAFLDVIVKLESAKLDIGGTVIYEILEESYHKHCIAVHRFRSNIIGKKLIGFDRVWNQYKYPDDNKDQCRFGYYITPDSKGNERCIKPEFVIHKINSFLSYMEP